AGGVTIVKMADVAPAPPPDTPGTSPTCGPPMSRFLIALCVVCGAGRAPAAAAGVSFERDVMAVLSRAGCNSGACHGNLNGKAGFRLSLRGQVPDFDFAALTRDMLGRRLDRMRPTESLLLAKATMRVPHEGGLRFNTTSLEHNLLRRWIAEGAKFDA